MSSRTHAGQIEPIQRRKLSDEVLDRLVTMIRDGQLRPGGSSGWNAALACWESA